jgi:NadR type nicotinamide-nucleotide adenylyltransferase
VKKVAVIGPECTGKSVLSARLAAHFKTVWVPEFAREYLQGLARPYRESDLLAIAQGQLRLEDELEPNAHDLLVCDTNLYVIKIWSKFRYGRVDEEILRLIKERHYDFYLVTNVDIPWVHDPQREHPHRRKELYDLYLEEMKNQPIPFVEIEGEGENRTHAAVAAVEKILQSV